MTTLARPAAHRTALALVLLALAGCESAGSLPEPTTDPSAALDFSPVRFEHDEPEGELVFEVLGDGTIAGPDHAVLGKIVGATIVDPAGKRVLWVTDDRTVVFANGVQGRVVNRSAFELDDLRIRCKQRGDLAILSCGAFGDRAPVKLNGHFVGWGPAREETAVLLVVALLEPATRVLGGGATGPTPPP